MPIILLNGFYLIIYQGLTSQVPCRFMRLGLCLCSAFKFTAVPGSLCKPDKGLVA